MEGLNLDFLNRPTEPLSLQDLSALAAAALFWTSKEMKMAMEVLDRHYPLWRDHNSPLNIEKPCLEDLSVKMSNIVSRIFNQTKDQISLPQVLKTEIEKKVLEKVEEVINWILYLIRFLKLDDKTAERIYWTIDGRIDEDKIFQFFWLDQLVGEPVNWKKFDLNINLLQYLACFFGQEEYISSHLSDYIEAIKPLDIENNDIVFTIMKTIIRYYNAHYHDLKFGISENLKIPKYIILNKSTVGMVSLCERFCFYKPFLYFWDHLDATERFNYLDTLSRASTIYRYAAAIYETEQSLKIILFLMEQMNERQKYNFILNNFSDVILIFSRNKNCKKFSMLLIEHFLPIIHETEKRNLLTICADICNRSNQCDIELEIVKRLIKNARMHRFTRPGFIVTCVSTGSPLEVIKTFFENFNIPALKFIIKDESSDSRKKDLISIGRTKFRELIRNNDFQLINNFMDEVLSSKEEKEKFKQDFNFLDEWISKCRFDIADNVLTWMHGTVSQDIKIPFKNFCCSSIRRDYETIEKMLKWFFNTDGPLINNCQSKLEILNEFCSDLIYNVWFPNYKLENRVIATEISTKILIYSFSSEREIQNFKTNVLGNEERCIKFFCKNEWPDYPTWERGRLSALDNFLHFCNLPKEKMDCIRSSILIEGCRKSAPERQIQRGHTEESEGSSVM